MIKTLSVLLFFAVTTAHADVEIRSTIVQVTGPKTKLIIVNLLTAIGKSDSTIQMQRQVQIPDVVTVKAPFADLDFRSALSLMRSLAIEAANCPDQSDSQELHKDVRAEFLKRCYSHAINQDVWDALNFGAWDSRALRENRVALFSFGYSLTFKNLKTSQVNMIDKIVKELNSVQIVSQDRIKSKIEMATFY